MKRTALALLLVVIACKGGEGGDDGTGDTTSAVSVESTFGHSVSDPSNPSSTTFTNTGDPATTDPATTDPATTDPATTDPATTDPTGTTTDPTGITTGDTSDTIDPSTSTDPTASESDTSNPGGPCCEAQEMAGCGDANIEACVCATESFCCDVEWDVFCTVQTVLLGCAECPGIGGGGDCCAAHGNPGCDDDTVEQCVCNEDYVCCVDPWDDICVGIAMDTCAAC